MPRTLSALPIVLRALLPVVLSGCLPVIDNPTGDCAADGDGGRACYHDPDRQDQYLPDCAAPLDRELWRVFAQDEATAYVMPRPDATGLDFGLCAGEDAAMAELFERNGLCEEVADPAVVNAMDPAEALQITHALHERLVFEARQAEDGAWAVWPWVPDDELAAACAGPLDGVAAVQVACEGLIDRADARECPELYATYSQEQVQAFVDGLNELYGIEG